jgi:hypothetical protein
MMSAFLGVDRFRKSGHASAGRRYFDDGDPVFAAIAIKLDSGGPVIFRSAVFLSAAICVGRGPAQPADKASLTETPHARRGSKIDWTSAARDALLWCRPVDMATR